MDLNIGVRIRKQRELLGYTREELSEKIGVSPKFCAYIETGAKGMSVETLCKLSKELMISTDYILFGKVNSEVDEEVANLLSVCDDEKMPHLKQIIRTFKRATRN